MTPSPDRIATLTRMYLREQYAALAPELEHIEKGLHVLERLGDSEAEGQRRTIVELLAYCKLCRRAGQRQEVAA